MEIMRVLSIILGMTGIFANTTEAAGTDTLETGFRQPSPDARPWVYWFWLNGNITSAGITADLEAMKRVGIGGVLDSVQCRIDLRHYWRSASQERQSPFGVLCIRGSYCVEIPRGR
jgi:hypothetical protein